MLEYICLLIFIFFSLCICNDFSNFKNNFFFCILVKKVYEIFKNFKKSLLINDSFLMTKNKKNFDIFSTEK